MSEQHYELHIAGLTRYLPIMPISDDTAIAGFVILGDTHLVTAAATELIKKLPPCDILITAETKGIPLVAEMARQLGHPRYVVCRKSMKLYMEDPLITRVNSITTEHSQWLYLNSKDSELMKGKNVALVDDVISTGDSLRAMEKLVGDSGANIVAKAAILAEGEAVDRPDIIYLKELPLFHWDGEKTTDKLVSD